MRSVSNKAIRDFLSRGGARLTVVAVLGVLLLFIALGISDGETNAPAVTDPTTELAETCSSLEGVGRCRVMISYGEGGEVSAVAVLCDGAESVYVRERIIELISSLYGIGSHRITILKLHDGGAAKNISTSGEKHGIYTERAA